MLKLDKYITLNEETVKSPNLCDHWDRADLDRIGEWVFTGYTRDKASRFRWEQRTEAAMDLAMQISKAKTFPWPDCSNVAFPLVTIATMQFHARAYPAIVSGTQVVKYRVTAPDPQGEETRRAIRVGQHMSWQRLEEDEDWEEQHDRLLINVSVVGTAFKKSFFSNSKSYNESDLVLAKDLVIDYWAKSVEGAPRKTHVIPLFRNDIYERVQRKTFRNILEESWYKEMPSPPPATTQQIGADQRQGLVPPPAPDETTPFNFLEQHCDLDLDDDGYAEPYIITIEEQSHEVVRIVTRFDRIEDIEKSGNTIVKIRPIEYFTKYPFIPSPDGGIYDVGFGVLLGPLNESVNSLINQLIDSGTMSIAAGGFLGRGAKIRGGVYTFTPFEWKRVDSSGDDLHKSIVPLPVREPSAVLFQLLTLLVNYVNRISGATDMLVGENPGQNTPAQTSQEMVTQGMKIYSGIFKRIWRSMKEEFRKLYVLNGLYLPVSQTFGEAGQKVSRQDYLGDPSKIAPVADPYIVSEEIRLKKALLLKQMAMSTNGYNLEVVERRLLQALEVDGVDQIYPGVGDPQQGKVPPLPNFKMQVEQSKAQVKMAELQWEQQKFMLEMQEEQKLNAEQIKFMEAQIAEILSTIGAERAKQELERFGKIVEMLKSRNDLIGKRMDVMKQQMAAQQSQQSHMQDLSHTQDKHEQSLRHSEEKHELALSQQSGPQ